MKHRPDLFKRIQNFIDNSPFQFVSVSSVAKTMAESKDHVAACFEVMVECGFLVPVRPKLTKEQKRQFRFQKHRVRSSGDRYEIVNFDPSKVVEVEIDQGELKCPGCGRPIKRRHARSEYHDPHKCEMDNIRDIMGD